MSKCVYCGTSFDTGFGAYCSRSCCALNNKKIKKIKKIKNIPDTIVSIDVERGLELKIKVGGILVGTFCLSKTGCLYLSPNQKKRGNELNWDMLNSVFALGSKLS